MSMEPTRLGPAAALPGDARCFTHDPASTGIGIVHLGIGAFHRAHQAAYTQAALDAAGGNWGILGVSLRSAGVRDQLVPQQGLFTIVEQSAGAEHLQVVGSIADVLVAPENPGAVVAAIAAPGSHIVSLTITEKGYCHLPASGVLDPAHPDIVHDLANPAAPRSAIGLIVAGLAARRTAGHGGLALLCCDNLPHNGRLLARLVNDFARRRDPALADWIARHIDCPSTMVDRIVPATTPDDIARLAARTGWVDAAMVKAEPFSQWVIEDRFAGPRPAWEAGGAQFVTDVAPFELAKLRLLNGSHSSIAWLGQLMGLDHVHEAIAHPDLNCFITALMAEEIAPTLPAPPGLDLASYQRALLQRFANPALAHRTAQIAMDSSQKLPQRLLGTVRDRLAAGQPIARLALAVAAFMRHAVGRSDSGQPLAVNDPLSGALAAAANAGSATDMHAAFLALDSVFGPDLPRHDGFRDATRAAFAALLNTGAAATLEAMA